MTVATLRAVEARLFLEIKRNFGSRQFLTALGFAVILSVFESQLFPVGYREYLIHVFYRAQQAGELLKFFAVSGVILLSFGVLVIFTFTALTANRRFKLFYFFVFALAIFVQYGYSNAFDRFVIAEDLIVALTFTERSLWQEAIQAYWSWVAFIPVVVFGFLIFTSKFEREGDKHRLGFLVLAIFMFYSSLYPFASGSFPSASVSAFFRSLTFAGWSAWGQQHGPRDSVNYISDSRPQNNIVLIVDESVRADHLSLNGYSRQTTPYLDELNKRGQIFNWGHSVSGTTCSRTSNNLLLTGVQELPDHDGRILKNPTIFQYAKAMGYRTYYLDAKSSEFWIGRENDVQFVDEFLDESDFASQPVFDTDFTLADKLGELLRGEVGKFIWVSKYGIHFHYNRRFPADSTIWKPILATDRLDPDKRAELINSYDNAIRFNVDGFFRRLFKSNSATLNDTVFLYTSDHGQTLSEGGEGWTHCGATKNEALVPVMLITGQKALVDTGYKASHFNLFATMLDLMGFPESEVRYSYAKSLLKARSDETNERYYYFGNLNGKGVSDLLRFD